MSKPKIFAFGAEHVKKAPKIKEVKPTASQILVELLTAQEALGTDLHVGEASDVGAPQAYILDFGPTLKAEEYGIKKGDRVLLQGSFVPAPKYGDHTRRRGLLEVHNVKAVLVEEKVEE
jgi:hypothetical protein